MYIEPNGKTPPRDPWSFRQTGVYHKSSAANSVNQVVILHPNSEAVVQTNLEACEHATNLVLAKHPLNVHLMIVSTYLVHWQDYIESLASELEQLVGLT
jgi:hypothetical protein